MLKYMQLLLQSVNPDLSLRARLLKSRPSFLILTHTCAFRMRHDRIYFKFQRYLRRQGWGGGGRGGKTKILEFKNYVLVTFCTWLVESNLTVTKLLARVELLISALKKTRRLHQPMCRP